MAKNNPTHESDQPNKIQNFAINTLLITTYFFVALIIFFVIKAIVRITEGNFFVSFIIAPIFIIGNILIPMMIRDKILRKESKKYLYRVLTVGSILGIILFVSIIYPFVKDW